MENTPTVFTVFREQLKKTLLGTLMCSVFTLTLKPTPHVITQL